MKNLTAPALCCLLAMAPETAMAAHMCWIDHVEKTSAGVSVYFIDNRQVVIAHNGRIQAFQIAAAGTQPPNNDVSFLPALPAALGDKFSSHNTPEDSCSMEVVSKNNVLGVQAHAAFHPPSIPGGGGQVEDFIPAN